MSQSRFDICYYIQDVLRKEVTWTMTDEESCKIEELYELYEQPMYRIAYAILHNVQQAEDAVHDAFVAIMRSKANIGDIKGAETKNFIVQTIRNTAINRYRKNMKDSQHFTELDYIAAQIPDECSDVDECIKHMENTEAVKYLLSGLNESDREILLLRCCDELSFREIAQRLNLSEPAARKRYERAKKVARQQKGVIPYGKELFTI